MSLFSFISFSNLEFQCFYHLMRLFIKLTDSGVVVFVFTLAN